MTIFIEKKMNAAAAGENFELDDELILYPKTNSIF